MFVTIRGKIQKGSIKTPDKEYILTVNSGLNCSYDGWFLIEPDGSKYKLIKCILISWSKNYRELDN